MNPNIGKAIKTLRNFRGITQDELSAQIGRNKPLISKIERGCANPSLSSFFGIAKALNVKLWVLLYIAENNCEMDEIALREVFHLDKN